MSELVATPTEITRDKIMDFERALKEFEQTELPTDHFFAPGMYMRRIFIPAGTCLTGKIHKHAHLNICTGDLSVMTENGIKRLTGQHVILSTAGIKRVGFAHADTTWITCHLNPTDETDVKKLEDLNVTDTFELLDESEKALCLS